MRFFGCLLKYLSVWIAFMMMVTGFLPECRARNLSESSLISSITIALKDVSADSTMLKKLAGRMITLKVGDSFSIEALQKSIDILKGSDLFQKIHIPDPVEKEGRIELTFELTPFSLIKEIHVDGEFPMLEAEVIKVMNLRVGDPFDPKAVPELEKSVLTVFLKNGYINPKVSVISKLDKEDGRTSLFVTIQKGGYYHIKRVALEGNRAEFDLELLTRLKTWQASELLLGAAQFLEKDVDRDLKNLIRLYRQDGYADVEIVPVITKNAETREVEILFRIQEGPRYKILFSGNTAFSDAELKKELPLFERGNSGDLALKRGVRAIRDRYLNAGYSKVQVKIVDDTAKEKEPAIRDLTIRIEEGPQTRIRTLRIQGNERMEEGKIRAKMTTSESGLGKIGGFYSKAWEEDKKAIAALYRENGFLNLNLDEALTLEKDSITGGSHLDVVLNIQEGKQTLVGKTVFNGLSVLTEKEAQEVLVLKSGAPYQEDRIRDDKSALLERISEKGYPYAAVSESVGFQEDHAAADITYNIDEGPYVRIGDLFVRGNFRTNRKVVLDRVEVREGKSFSLRNILEETRKVSRIQAFENTRLQLIGLDEKSEEVDVVWNVEERKPYLFEIGGGYDTAREFYALGRLEDRNLFGRNKSIWIDGEYSRISYLGEAGITDPDFFRSGISASGSFFAEKQEKKNHSFGIRRFGSSVNFQKSMRTLFEGGVAFRYEGRKQFRLDSEPILPEEQEQYEPRTLFTVTPSLQYASVDSYVRPKKGWVARGSLDASKGLDNTLDDFIRYRLEARYYLTPVNRITLALRARWGFIYSYASENDVADDQLFYLGGLGDVRGFEENMLRVDADGDAVGGREEFLGNMEVRYDLGASFEVSVFLDLGGIRDTETDIGNDDFRASMGIGLNYITPVGPVSLMYGHKLNRKEGESSGRIHFSIGYTF
jgi:outer membrane protein insertion porin family